MVPVIKEEKESVCHQNSIKRCQKVSSFVHTVGYISTLGAGQYEMSSDITHLYSPPPLFTTHTTASCDSS